METFQQIRDREADALLRSLSDERIKWGIDKARKGLAMVRGFAQTETWDEMGVGHPNIEMAMSKRGRALCDAFDDFMARHYRMALNDLLQEQNRRLTTSQNPKRGES